MNITNFDIMFVLMVVLGIHAEIRGRILLRAFIRKHPKIAEECIPEWDSPARHPEKLLFFFRASNRGLLQSDAQIWRLRQRAKWALILAFSSPFLGFFLVLLAQSPRNI
jgi:hypothetical protein